MMKSNIVYEIMHLDTVAASITGHGVVRILNERFLPYDLNLEEISENDIDTMMSNYENFMHWCASRTASLDRQYAKEMFNSIGAMQAVTDRDRAQIALSYHCASLTDVFWVRLQNENIHFKDVSLYDKTSSDSATDAALVGIQAKTILSADDMAPDLSAKGCCPKAWIRDEGGLKLLKGGSSQSVTREWLASAICQCFDIPQVKYEMREYKGVPVTQCNIITSEDRSIVSKMEFDVYASKHGKSTLEMCRELDPVTYYGMNILDYLTGNTDRHTENWGFLVNNHTNECISLYPLLDANQCFQKYDNLEGAVCQTVLPENTTQMDAAIEAVKHIGLPQIREMDMSKFGAMEQEAVMFRQRLEVLRNVNDHTI